MAGCDKLDGMGLKRRRKIFGAQPEGSITYLLRTGQSPVEARPHGSLKRLGRHLEDAWWRPRERRAGIVDEHRRMAQLVPNLLETALNVFGFTCSSCPQLVSGWMVFRGGSSPLQHARPKTIWLPTMRSTCVARDAEGLPARGGDGSLHRVELLPAAAEQANREALPSETLRHAASDTCAQDPHTLCNSPSAVWHRKLRVRSDIKVVEAVSQLLKAGLSHRSGHAKRWRCGKQQETTWANAYNHGHTLRRHVS